MKKDKSFKIKGSSLPLLKQMINDKATVQDCIKRGKPIPKRIKLVTPL